jgi:hypothetical protein
MKSPFSCLIAAGALLLSFSPRSEAYSIAPLPSPSMRMNGTVRDVLVEPDGHIIVAGAFSEVGGQPRANLARLRPDGSLDESWRFDTNAAVTSVARSPSGQIYVAGGFSQIDGESRYGLARLSPGPMGMSLDAWAPGTAYSEKEIEVAAAGDVIVLDGGLVTRYASGGIVADSNWGAAAALAPAWDIAVSPDGEFVATCTNYDEIVKLTRLGQLVWRKSWDGYCNEIEFAPDGALFAARIIQQPEYLQVVSRIDVAGNYSPAWEVPLEAPVDAFGFLPNGQVLVGTALSRGLSHGVEFSSDQRGGVLRFAADGQLLANELSFANGNVEQFGLLPGGDLLISGTFSVARHARRDGLVRLSADLIELKPALVSIEVPRGLLTTSMRLADGGYLVAGRFTQFMGQPRRFLARLSADFDLLPDQWPLDHPPTRLVADAAGNCYLGSLFPIWPEASASTLVRFSGCSTLDATWLPNEFGRISALVHGGAADDAVYVGSCADATVAAPSDCRVHRFDAVASGTIAPDWTIAANNEVNALLPKGSALFVGGAFTAFAGDVREKLAKIDVRQSGSGTATWTAQRVPNTVKSMVSTGDQEIIVGGTARNSSPIGPRPSLVRLDAATGAENSAWRPWQTLLSPYSVGAMALSADGYLYFNDALFTCCLSRVRASGAVEGTDSSFSVGHDGRIYQIFPGYGGDLVVAGSFDEIAGVPRHGIARLTEVSTMIHVDGFE